MQEMNDEIEVALSQQIEDQMAEEPLLQLFKFKHLPDNLRFISRHFAFVAVSAVTLLPRNPERSVCLRKLREAKDCAVMAALWKQVG